MYAASFEDTIFILNIRIRMIKDTLRLNPPPELFLERTLDDLEFTNNTLELLTETLIKNVSEYGGNGEFEYLSDTEWQFSQLLTEFSLESSPFSVSIFPETRKVITMLRENGNVRRKNISEYTLDAEIALAEPVVSSAELSGLLSGN